MVKIALLVPHEDMLEKAGNIIKEKQIEVGYMKAIQTVDAVNEARLAVEAGAHIIVARGYQAKLIKEYTNIPLVEMRFHAQEMGLLIVKAREIAKKEHARIGVLAFDNMLCDMSHMGELLGVHLVIAHLESVEDTIPRLEELAAENLDVIIGGEITCRLAEEMGYPTLFYEATEESITEALQAATRMAYAAEAEKQNTAQFETVLDTSFSGIIKLNAEGNIIVVNKTIENLIGKNAEDVLGLPVSEVFPEFDTEVIRNILAGKRESYTSSVNLRHQVWILLAAPIQYDGQITGAILSIHKAGEMIHNKSFQNNMVLHGFTAQTQFDHIYTENWDMRKVLELAKEYALSESPLLFYAEAGPEAYLIAEAVHNNSIRRSGPFVSVNMEGLDPGQQAELLFGSELGENDITSRLKGAMAKANHGTIFIKGIEYLTFYAQHQILRVLYPGHIIRTDAQPMENLDVRIMAHSRVNLRYLVKNKKFSEELFYYLQGLNLEIPSFNERPEDLRYYFDRYFTEYLRKYNKYLVLTEGAYDKIQQLSWKGNQIQVKTFCERLVLTADKRSIDEVKIQKQYSELYPHLESVEVKGEEQIVVYKHPEAAELSALLEKYHGNRNLVAEELGISTTTLWRRMKKYGVEAKF